MASSRLLTASHHGHVHGITQYKMASNIQRAGGRDREIAGLILLFR